MALFLVMYDFCLEEDTEKKLKVCKFIFSLEVSMLESRVCADTFLLWCFSSKFISYGLISKNSCNFML